MFARFALLTPAVCRLVRSGGFHRRPVAYSRANVLLRDGFRCQYCGARKPARELNQDHVVPRARGGRASWENIVASCYRCNQKKGNRTPEEADAMKLMDPKSVSAAFAMGKRQALDDVSELRDFLS